MLEGNNHDWAKTAVNLAGRDYMCLYNLLCILLFSHLFFLSSLFFFLPSSPHPPPFRHTPTPHIYLTTYSMSEQHYTTLSTGAFSVLPFKSCRAQGGHKYFPAILCLNTINQRLRSSFFHSSYFSLSDIPARTFFPTSLFSPVSLFSAFSP